MFYNSVYSFFHSNLFIIFHIYSIFPPHWWRGVFCIFQFVDMVDFYFMQLCFPKKAHKKIFVMAFPPLRYYHNITRDIINQNLSVNFINLESCTKWLVGSIAQKLILKTCVELPCCFISKL